MRRVLTSRTSRASSKPSFRARAVSYPTVDANTAHDRGYYRWPVVRGTDVFFVCEDDIYAVSTSVNGAPRRLTQAHGACERPVASAAGDKVAFTCIEDGYVELYVVDANGGPMKQLTHMGASYARACCFSPDGTRVYFSSSAAASEPTGDEIWVVDVDVGAPVRLGIGPVHDLDVRVVDGREMFVIGRNTEDPAVGHWRGYKGGACGEIWVGPLDDLKRIDALDALEGNFGNVQWMNDRVLFTMERDGSIDAFSCDIDGGDVRRHTSGGGFPVRHVSVDRSSSGSALGVTYMKGGKIYHLCDAAENTNGEALDITWRGPRVQLSKRFVHADDWIENWDLHPEGVTIMLLVRGQAFTMGIWDGPVLSYPPAKELKTPKGQVAAPLASVLSKAQPRTRLGAYLYDGERLVFVTDASGEEDIEVHYEEAGRTSKRLGLHHGVLGRVEELLPSPEAPLVAIVNHRNALLIVNIDNGDMRTADTSCEGITDLTWSPCGNFLAYTYFMNYEKSCIRVLDVRKGTVFDATKPVLGDHSPAWDADGKYLYFLGSRELEPVYDAAKFGLAFPHVERPHLIILQKDVRNPMLKELKPPYDSESGSGSDYDSDSDPRYNNAKADSKKASSSKKDKPDDDSDWSTVDEDADDGENDEDASTDDDDDDDESYSGEAPPPIKIDTDGLTERVVALQMPISRYGCLCGLEDGRFMVVEYPPSRGAPGGVGTDYSSDDEDGGYGTLISYSVKDLRRSILIHGGVGEVTLSIDRKCMIVEKETDGYLELRVYKAGVRPEEDGSDSEELDQHSCDRRTGLINLDGRVRVLVDPAKEWAQMLGEVYRRLRDDFWCEDMNGVDWEGTLKRYEGILPTISTRRELSDMLTEMSAELGCSHVSVTSGDPGRSARRHSAGYLGADFVWDASVSGYRIVNIVKGDSWDDARGGVLSKPGVNISEGDILLNIDRIPLTEHVSPAALLVEKGGSEVLLTVKIDSEDASVDKALKKLSLKDKKKKSKESKDDSRPKKGDIVPVRVRAMYSELDARYRDMIECRTRTVHAMSDGVVGYLHVPDMESTGYSEFWRHYACEVRKGSLVLDLRGNTGGHISELLLSKLSQRALAWDIPRRGELQVYPSNTPGPLVMLVNERTGSDAELMAESFRKLGLGIVVGTRTWGGLLSIHGSADLIDGSEVSIPSQNVLLVDEIKDPSLRTNKVENVGVYPDVCVNIKPSDYAAGADPQLERAVKEALTLLNKSELARAPSSLRKTHRDDTLAAEIERAETKDKPWSFATWAPLPPTLEEEQAAAAKKAKRSARRKANTSEGAERDV